MSWLTLIGYAAAVFLWLLFTITIGSLLGRLLKRNRQQPVHWTLNEEEPRRGTPWDESRIPAASGLQEPSGPSSSLSAHRATPAVGASGGAHSSWQQQAAREWDREMRRRRRT